MDHMDCLQNAVQLALHAQHRKTIELEHQGGIFDLVRPPVFD